MKLALLIAIAADDKTNALVLSAPIPYDEALRQFKAAVAVRQIPETAAAAGCNILEIWTRSGRAKHHSFPVGVPRTPAPVVESAEPAGEGGAPVVADPAVVPPVAPVVDPSAGKVSVTVDSIAARLEAGEEVTEADLEQLTVPQLTELAGRYEIELPAKAVKADIIAAILSE
jgi:hypothetical protein